MRAASPMLKQVPVTLLKMLLVIIIDLVTAPLEVQVKDPMLRTLLVMLVIVFDSIDKVELSALVEINTLEPKLKPVPVILDIVFEVSKVLTVRVDDEVTE